MKKKAIYIASLALALLSVSCNDFLDVRPKGDKVENDLFSTAQGFEDAIYGVYGSMTSPSLYGRDFTWGLTDVLAQDLYCADGNYGADLSRYKYEENEYVRKRFVSLWTEAYKTIGYANNVLQNLETKPEGSFPRQAYYKGEMLAVRAMIHFDLLRLFASRDESKTAIPYVTSYSFSVKPFSTVAQCYDAIIRDLKDAEALLKDDETDITWPRNNGHYEKFLNWRHTHLNVHAVRALLARVYWTRGNLAEAAANAVKVIDSNAFPLCDPAEIQDNQAGVVSPNEAIFGLYSTSHIETCESQLYNFISPGNCWAPYDDVSGSAHLLPWNKLYNLDIESTQQDFRKSCFREKGSHTYWLKVTDYRKLENLQKPADAMSGINLIRIPEMYLIAADALLSTNPAKAKELFNLEVTSRGLNALRADEDLTADRIFNEFHKELFGEGQQWFNMKRLNKDIQSNMDTKVIPASEDVYVVPVPKEEFDYRD